MVLRLLDEGKVSQKFNVVDEHKKINKMRLEAVN